MTLILTSDMTKIKKKKKYIKKKGENCEKTNQEIGAIHHDYPLLQYIRCMTYYTLHAME